MENVKEVRMTLNARVEMLPEKLEEIVLETLANITEFGVEYEIKVLNCLQPGRPNPTYRYGNIAQ